ncbi:MAG: hypothetical protein V3U49_07510, partial [Nitrososphaerales archaeon]
MPMTRNYTTLLLYILLSILLLVLPLSNVAYAQSETIPGPIDELIENIEKAIAEVQKEIKEAFAEFCESLSEGSPGERIICPLILTGRVER